MILIARDWDNIRAEYIGGGISYQKLADKYDIPYMTLRNRATEEKWGNLRKNAGVKSCEKAVIKTAEAAANNAVIAERIKTKLLKRLEKEIDALPEKIGSDAKQSQVDYTYDGRKIAKTKTTSVAFRIRELTAAYKDLTGEKIIGNDVEDLSVLGDLLK